VTRLNGSVQSRMWTSLLRDAQRSITEQLREWVGSVQCAPYHCRCGDELHYVLQDGTGSSCGYAIVFFRATAQGYEVTRVVTRPTT